MKKHRCFPLPVAWKISLLLLTFTVLLEAEELTFITINIWSGLDYIGTLKMGEYESKEIRESRYLYLLDELKRLQPDVIAVNEANLLPAYAKRLARDLDYDQAHTYGNVGIKIIGLGLPVNLREGDVLLARKSLGMKNLGRRKISGDKYGIYSRFLAVHFNESNFIILGRIQTSAGDIYIANTHLHASVLMEPAVDSTLWVEVTSGAISTAEDEAIRSDIDARGKRRVDEVTRLMDFIDTNVPAGAPLVLMGDFNDLPGSEIYSLLTETYGFTDSFGLLNPESPGHTWNPEINTNIRPLQTVRYENATDIHSKLKSLDANLAARIDYIFTRYIAAAKIKSSEVIMDIPREGVFPSDHFGVMTKIDF